MELYWLYARTSDVSVLNSAHKILSFVVCVVLNLENPPQFSFYSTSDTGKETRILDRHVPYLFIDSLIRGELSLTIGHPKETHPMTLTNIRSAVRTKKKTLQAFTALEQETRFR